ncbi:MAG TPA: S-layer homology domain-containing protein [Acidimicrobiia bacterium]|jgi:hypothetical protein
MNRSKRRRLSLMTVAFLLLLPTPAVAQATDPYASDPLDLIALRDQTREYSAGTDPWQVWICDVPDGTVTISPAQAVSILNGALTPYYQSLSANQYAPTFTAGGTVLAVQNSGWPADPFRLQAECENLVFQQASAGGAGALVVVDATYQGGYATGGFTCPQTGQCPTVFPNNARMVVVGGGALVSVNGQAPALRTVAHEIGHALFWPHSFGGLVTFENGIVYEYDNPMDLMSGGDDGDLNIGTIAVNRYAAGWIGSESVAFHRGGDLTYTIGASGGTQMLVLPTETAGTFEFLGVRIRSGTDFGLPAEGVEVYRVDQSVGLCAVTPAGACYGTDRRTAPVPAEESFSSTLHVHDVGAEFPLRDMTITVLARQGSSYTVRVVGNAVAERFVDDNGNLHEAAITAIAARGITRGCNPPLVDHYCPASNVTRAEMAAFLVVALGEAPAAAYSGYFPDVVSGAWYTPYVEKLRELGITTGNADGTYAPDRSVTRAEMAVFLTRAFGLTAGPPGSAFGDVPDGQWYAPAVEAIRLAGITTGCMASPPSYCPVDPVKRDQMASFLVRALGI